MADVQEIDGAGNGGNKNISPQKRKADDKLDNSDTTLAKKISKSGGESLESLAKKPTGTISMSFGKKPAGISMNLGGGLKKINPAPIKMALSATTKETPALKPKTAKVASVFNEDSESEDEEMPQEAKMRMRNVGRETPTAAGPNSFGKGNMGFCDRTKMIERELKKQMEEFGDKADANYKT